MKKIHAVATNRTVRLLAPYPYDKLVRVWSFSHPQFQYMRGKFGDWDGRIKFLRKDGSLPAGLFWATKGEVARELGIRFKLRTRLEGVVCRDGIVSDRDYQNDCVDRMLAAIEHGGGLVLNATGTGKTRIAGIFASRVDAKVCFIVDQLDLLEQAVAELEDTLGEKVGYVGNSIYRPERITVATVQTIHKHIRDKKFRKWFRSLELLIIDEIHVQMAKRNFKTVEKIKPLAVFGLTATLELRKKPVRIRAWSICGPVLYEYPLEQGMKENVLSKGVIVRVLYKNHIEV